MINKYKVSENRLSIMEIERFAVHDGPGIRTVRIAEIGNEFAGAVGHIRHSFRIIMASAVPSPKRLPSAACASPSSTSTPKVWKRPRPSARRPAHRRSSPSRPTSRSMKRSASASCASCRSTRAHAFFHQVEALYVDRNVSFTDLKQALLLFAREMFGEDTKIRLRPSYFPFTEPSAEMDISCNICGGKGCPFCKHTGWVEILGCGMVDPNVLELNGIDSKIYSGYALGMGIERITNLKYRVNDLRLFSENDTRFLKEFESAY